ncbi:MAG: hypothetical protein AB1896_03605 [Thermodesulfobacteriota bacterium]
MFRKTIKVAVCCLALWLSAPPAGWADVNPGYNEGPDLQALFDQYWRQSIRLPAVPPLPAHPGGDCPGWLAEGWAEKPEALFCEPWPFRQVTYEILLPDRRLLARTIYGLALFTGDLDPSVTLARFERGVGGFHYRVEEVAGWAGALRDGGRTPYTPEEKALLDRLLADRVLAEKDGRTLPTGRFRHILGAAPLDGRSLELNLNHERTHVAWDEDPDFKERHLDLWRSLAPGEKETFLESLKGYGRGDEEKLIEEWAVRLNETRPAWRYPQ